ncbi:MAG: hypothetical protein A2505_09570 [Deltaproteobacteria bacterium RIFOXYD12_FULL_55_16]|nr:MAG: hypothetical protein A2505_09570 [Deltaproteobacteria bacterium RIFOXYD12_FULL_55_16]
MPITIFKSLHLVNNGFFSFFPLGDPLSVSKKSPTPKPARAKQDSQTAATIKARPSRDNTKSSSKRTFTKKTRKPAAASSSGREFTDGRKPRAKQAKEETFRPSAPATDRPTSRKRNPPSEKTFGPKTRGPGPASPRGRAFTRASEPQAELSEDDFWSPASASDRSFASFLKPLIPSTIGPEGQAILYSSPLAHLDYSVELQIKDQGLLTFWKQHRLPGLPGQVIRSPRARNYRTTSKRKAFLHGSTLYLLLGDKAALPKNRQYFTASPLEPKEHEVIYRFLQQKLSEPAFRLIAGHLNYLIIRGSYTEQAVIFNVDLLNGPLVRKMKLLSAHLQKLPVAVSAAFVYLDPSQSDYYLESKRPAETLNFKKLYGPDQLGATYHDCRYQFHPTSFSQINESMVETMLTRARELLAPAPDQALLDLYCGYGLFSHYLAPYYRQVLAVDGEGPSIRAAEVNSRLNQKRGGQAKPSLQNNANNGDPENGIRSRKEWPKDTSYSATAPKPSLQNNANNGDPENGIRSRKEWPKGTSYSATAPKPSLPNNANNGDPENGIRSRKEWPKGTSYLATAPKFIAHRITVGYLEKTLPPPMSNEVILLDPPRQGTLPGVIAALARRKPKKALHIFCGVDQIPPALREWQANGYQVRRIVPLDMFPGSANLEILILLERLRAED